MNFRHLINGLYAFIKRRQRIAITLCVLGVIALFGALLLTASSPKRVAAFIFAFVWLFHLALGAGAGYAALRLWNHRQHPLIWRLGLYINGFIIEALTAVVLIFVARGVRFTWKFSIVMFAGALLGDVVRAPLIMYLIKGPAEEAIPANTENSGAMPPDFWRKEFREAVREELEPIKIRLDEVERKIKGSELDH